MYFLFDSILYCCYLVVILIIMSNLQYRQEKIQQKRKQTPWRDFVREICSWYPFMFYKNNGLNSTIKSNDRIKVIDHKHYEDTRDNLLQKSFE